MLDKIGHIKNPLTVIAMFAAIAEVSGAIVLPFIEAENQATYIWFLMIFPALLVIVFFVTLNFNHKVLYAPSDWKDESNFFRMFTKATAAERKEKLRSEYVEPQVSPTAPPEVSGATQVQTPREASANGEAPTAGRPGLAGSAVGSGTTNKVGVKRYRMLERAAISKLSSMLGLDFQQDIVYQAAQSRRIVFDAVALEANKVTAAEVRLIFSENFSQNHLQKVLLEAERVAESLRDQQKEFVLHIVAVLDLPGANVQQLKARLQDVASRFEYNIKVHIFNVDELQAEAE